MADASLAGLVMLIDARPHASVGDSFRVRSIPGYPRHYIGRSSSGHPSLLLGSERGTFHAPVRLALLEARFGGLHRIHPVGGEEREEHLSVVTCTAQNAYTQEYFLHVCETILRIVGRRPAQHTIVEAVQRLIELFRRLSRPASRSLNGLLGELLLIAGSRSVSATVAAWRSSEFDRFDFSTANVRLDVKASSDRLRVHHLSAEQCQPPAGTVGLLASLFVESSGGGQSLQELVEQIEVALAGDNDLALRVQENVANTLGESLPSAMDTRFDDRLALASLRFYDLATVPGIRGCMPPEVSGVRFRSDLTRTTPLSEHDIHEMSIAALQFMPR